MLSISNRKSACLKAVISRKLPITCVSVRSISGAITFYPFPVSFDSGLWELRELFYSCELVVRPRTATQMQARPSTHPKESIFFFFDLLLTGLGPHSLISDLTSHSFTSSHIKDTVRRRDGVGAIYLLL